MSSLRLGYYTQASVIMIQAISPLHVGIGRSVGVVDLPVQRDALGFPTIFASSLKGSLRAAFNRLMGEKDCTNIIFGPGEGIDENYYAGAFNTLDAKLLLLPVRSLIGVYALVTSPIMLRNFKTYIEASHVGASEQNIKVLLEALRKTIAYAETLNKGEVLVNEGGKKNLSLRIAESDAVILADEFRLSPRVSPVIGELSKMLEAEEDWRLAVVHDDLVVNSLLERSLLRQTRVALETETKKVKQGHLWTEEDLPPQTVLYTVFFYSEPRTKTGSCQELLSKSNATGVKELFEKTILPNGCGFMIFGGHETVGRGVAKLRKVM
ncbi:MAG: type III-B CRISPR module RAMP protein Cmr4 [Candidatus Bathyarchaeia archaeon]